MEPIPLRMLEFLKFPTKVQDKIYQLLFVKHECGIYINITDDNDTITPSKGVWMLKAGYTKMAQNDDSELIQGTNLLATCSQIYKAARGVLYGCNDFEFGWTSDVIPFLDRMNKDTALHIRSLNLGYLLPKDFKKAVKLLLKCANLQKLHLHLEDMIEFRTVHQPERVVPPFEALLKQMHDNNKDGTSTKVTWDSSYPEDRHATKEEMVAKKAFNMKMRKLIKAHGMPNLYDQDWSSEDSD